MLSPRLLRRTVRPSLRTLMQINEQPSLASRIGPGTSGKRKASMSSFESSSKSPRADDIPPRSRCDSEELPAYRPRGAAGSMHFVRGRGSFSNASKRGRGGSKPPGRGIATSSKKASSSRNVAKPTVAQDTLPGPLNDEAYIKKDWHTIDFNVPHIAQDWQKNPKSALGNYMGQHVGRGPKYEVMEGTLHGRKIVR